MAKNVCRIRGTFKNMGRQDATTNVASTLMWLSIWAYLIVEIIGNMKLRSSLTYLVSISKKAFKDRGIISLNYPFASLFDKSQYKWDRQSNDTFTTDRRKNLRRHKHFKLYYIIIFNLSKVWRITNVILPPFEGLHAILQPF